MKRRLGVGCWLGAVSCYRFYNKDEGKIVISLEEYGSKPYTIGDIRQYIPAVEKIRKKGTELLKADGHGRTAGDLKLRRIGTNAGRRR